MKNAKQAPLIDMHKFVLEQLKSRKGDWKNISESTGVPYFTISKIASGVTVDPRISSCQRLADFFSNNPKDVAA